jgi:hypothetical protein
MTDTIVKIMIEVLGILAIATNEVKQRRPSQLMICNDWRLRANVHQGSI